VDDILLFYGQRKTNIDKTLAEFNEQQPTKTFTIERELHNSINFLELPIYRRKKEIKLQYTEHPLKQIP
jgi:hypothetical protein